MGPIIPAIFAAIVIVAYPTNKKVEEKTGQPKAEEKLVLPPPVHAAPRSIVVQNSAQNTGPALSNKLPAASIKATNVTSKSATVQWDISNIKLPRGYAAIFAFHVRSENGSYMAFWDRETQTSEFHFRRILEGVPKGTVLEASLQYSVGHNKKNYQEIQTWASRGIMRPVELSSTTFATPIKDPFSFSQWFWSFFK